MKTPYRRPSKARYTSACALLLGLGTPSLAWAQQKSPVTETAPEDERKDTGSLGLAPGIPQVSALPGGFAPAYSPDAQKNEDWHADFHGYVSMPLRLGFNNRAGNVTDQQYSTVIHAPPVVPEYRDAFSYTSVLTDPYVQLNFAYGNSVVQANVILQARSANTAMSFFDASTRGGITDAFLTFDLPDLSKAVGMKFHVGAFTNRYGATGEYDEGKYGTPLIARTNGVGENIIANLKLGDFDIELQQGFQGQLDKAPLGIVPGDWNDYADPNIGTGLVHHLHAGIGYKGYGGLGFHYLHAWSADERANMGTTPDGKIDVLAADLRLALHRFGHLYVAGSYTDALYSRSVGRIIEIQNALGGPGLMRSYLGPASNGTGTLLTFGGQYDLSIARLLYGNAFEGFSPDIMLSFFANSTSVTSADANWDNKQMFKWGTEAAYALWTWVAAGVRFDSVSQDLSDADKSFYVISPRIIFRSDWQSRDQVTLQYSKYLYGSQVYVRNGSPAQIDPTINPDEDVISLAATMWW
ncbi:MAG TPA: hypothetical protein VLC09_10580 [Polyangiaceae bacterium]|nr:hypothetical protein [Polyangiaceae bacterium]